MDNSGRQDHGNSRTVSVFPPELEIQIISYVPFAYYATLRQVCKRWHAITLLPDLLYLPVKTQHQTSPRTSFKAIEFKIHKAIYEGVDFWGNSRDYLGFRIPRKNTLQLISPYLDNQLMIPPLPHTLQDVNLTIAMPPNPTRPSRPGYVSKLIPIPCKTSRKLLLSHDPTDTNKIEITNLNGEKEVTGVTIREFFDSLKMRGRIRSGDVLDTIILNWRVRDLGKEWWWKDWDIGEGIYQLVLKRYGQVDEERQVWHESI